ncbi:hypothetical protein AGLY_000686 [Aphis glycines]|uniref:GTPase-activating protein n=1 Tax=Aphis glycines TaxID=307491 RepID=A0A6G0U868_APHGL|nr:GTPase-activating protein isoform X2 [Aphis gossypii]KAE9545143.1 hypothetical protein AGLY_000686 [Aphis glycines]
MTMAEGKPNFRVVERLKIKIGDAKNLGKGHSSLRDGHCTITLDQEEIFRTATIEKAIDPFWGEEFEFEIPRRFRYLGVCVYERDRPLGRVTVRRDQLTSFNDKDHWFPLRPLNVESEVQGKIHIEIEFGENRGRLGVRLNEACELAITNGNCDPFADVTVRYTNDKTETQRTKVKKKTNSPVFDEAFAFTLPGLSGIHKQHIVGQTPTADWAELIVTLYHEISSSNTVFLGQVTIPLQGRTVSAWYFLQPRNRKSSLREDQGFNYPSVGSLRLKIHYTADHVLPSHNYERLKHLLLNSHAVVPTTASTVYLLGEIIPNKIDSAQPIVRILLHHGQIIPTIKALAYWEISKVTDANTIFRGNSLVSKMMDESMHISGMRYLHETLRPPLERLLAERRPCEIDPARVKDTTVISHNLANLKIYVEDVFKAITTSALKCPTVMCQLFHTLKEVAIKYFPENKEIKYSVVSGFIFLRFFAPAILGPRLFDLTKEQIDSQTNRTLTLVSKTIQSLGNLVCSRSNFKEEYMSSMYQSVYTEQHVTAVRQFLEIISASAGPEECTQDTPVTLKEGMLTKRAQGRKKFGRKNFKQRYFKLTTRDLSYAKQKGKESLCTITLSDILAVERLQQESFNKNNMFQIIQPERILYIQANNCVEEKEWVDLLTKMCFSNNKRLTLYHPAAFINGTWLCCKSNNERTKGCQEVSTSVDHIQTSSVDVDRELSRIHALCVTHIDRFDSVLKACECKAVYPGDRLCLPILIEDPKTTFITLSTLREIIYTLEQEHRTVLRTIARETKYGSKQAPIGDDNYLLLAGRKDLSAHHQKVW